jgi:serine/threonine protein kinase
MQTWILPDKLPYAMLSVQVFKAMRGGVQTVAAKMLEAGSLTDLENFKKEIDFMKVLSRDANIVQFYGCCVKYGRPLMVMEYLEGGDVRQAMSQCPEGELSCAGALANPWAEAVVRAQVPEGQGHCTGRGSRAVLSALKQGAPQ